MLNSKVSFRVFAKRLGYTFNLMGCSHVQTINK